jgi:LemA protein
MLVAVVLIVIVAITVLGAVLGFNSLVRKRDRTGEAWSQIDVELKRRHDLIPHLVARVKVYAAHESGTLNAVTTSRASAIRAGNGADPDTVAAAEDALSTSLRSLFAVAENYPALRAQEGFLALQEQLAATEDQLEYSRRYYNTSARDFNTAIQSFPRTLLVVPVGFHAFEFFQTGAAEKENPTVDFTAAARPSSG